MTTRDPEATATDRASGWSPRRIALLSGAAEAIVLVGGILLAAYVFTPTQSFSWTGDLSQFGELRHHSIALGGLLSLLFLWPVWADATNRLQRFGVGVFGVAWIITASANALAAAGAEAGEWAVIGLILLYPVALLIYGGGDVYAGHRQRGSISLLLGVAYVVNLWLLFPLPPAPPGYELIFYVASFVLVSIWAAAMYLALRRSSPGFH